MAFSRWLGGPHGRSCACGALQVCALYTGRTTLNKVSARRRGLAMAELTGSEILAKSLKNEGTDILFFLMGGPMLLAESSCIKEGIRPLDVRHEQAAALMGQAYSRLLQKPSVCMAASGPGVINLTTGIANALIDCAPVVAIGGSSPIGHNGRQVFQEIDQVAIMKPCTKWADRVYSLKRIPEQVNNAFQHAMSGKPGPVYLDFPGDILYAKMPEEQVDWSLSGRPLLNARPLGDPKEIERLIEALAKAEQPIILSGSGVIWSRALGRVEGPRRAGRHSLLHDAARPRRTARRSSLCLPRYALDGVPRGRSDPHRRYAHELHHHPRRGTALQRQRHDRAHRHRRRPARVHSPHERPANS